MSFATGTADSRENLLDLFKIFAESDGWLIDRHAAMGTGYVLNMHKMSIHGVDLYAHLRTTNNETLAGRTLPTTGLAVSMSDSYSASADCTDQPGAPVNVTNTSKYFCSSVYPVTTGTKYWFFSEVSPAPEFLGMVLLLPNGQYRHIHIGDVKCTDADIIATTKCSYFFATDGMNGANQNCLPFETSNYLEYLPQSSWLRMIADERDGWWNPRWRNNMGGGSPTEGYAVGPRLRDTMLLVNSRNRFSNMAMLCPINLYYLNNVNVWTPVGYLNSVRIGRRDAFIVDHVYPLGTDHWMAFPAYSGARTFSLVYRKVD